ncbi:MAG: hypothetical protein C0428_01200 [Polaromonas sp.]|nr:hypothetical protein [Polaromonas sp.]
MTYLLMFAPYLIPLLLPFVFVFVWRSQIKSKFAFVGISLLVALGIAYLGSLAVVLLGSIFHKWQLSGSLWVFVNFLGNVSLLWLVMLKLRGMGKSSDAR